MSLIQEALKRQQEEANAQGPEKTPPPSPPPAPAPAPADADADAGDRHRRIGLSRQAPVAVQAEQQNGRIAPDPAVPAAAVPAARKRSHTYALAGALLAVLALVAALVLGAYSAYQKWGGGAEVPAANEDPAQTSESDFVPASPDANDAIAAPPTTGAISTASASATNLLAAGSAPSNEVASTNGAASMSEPAGGLSRFLSLPRVQRPEDPAPQADPTPPDVTPQLTEWPLITVGGFLGGGRHGSVILNGEMKAVGETIMDVEITAIESRGVVLRYLGQTKVLKMGQSTQ